VRHMNISVPLASGGTEVTYGIKPLAAAVLGLRHPARTHPISHTDPSRGTGIWRRGHIATRAERITRGTANTRLSTGNRPSARVNPRLLTHS